jgi:hypothetical protein
MFDHKPVFLSVNNVKSGEKNINHSKRRITNWFLEDDLLCMSVSLAGLQVFSKTIDENSNGELVLRLANSINILTKKLLDCVALKEKIALNITGYNGMDEMLLAATVTEFKEHLETLPGWEYLNNCNSKYTGKQVFVALTERITEKVSGIQLKLTKLKNIKKKNMEKKSTHYLNLTSKMRRKFVSLRKK